MFNERRRVAADYLLIEKNSMLTVGGSVCAFVWRLQATCVSGVETVKETLHTSARTAAAGRRSSSSLPAAADAVDPTLRFALTIFPTQHWGVKEAPKHPGALTDVFECWKCNNNKKEKKDKEFILLSVSQSLGKVRFTIPSSLERSVSLWTTSLSSQ